MKGQTVDKLIYGALFPRPKPTDPPDFSTLLTRQLVPEVRLETAAFYGSLDSREAQYPGLDYSYLPHRRRLSRFTWHRRLFRAFDALGLTDSEIAGLTKWEGTRWAKERFEREQGITIRDTTGDGIPEWVDPELRMQDAEVPHVHWSDEEEGELDDAHDNDNGYDNTDGLDDDAEDTDMDISDSVGNDLNARLMAAIEEREAGNLDIVLDAEWEQWFKEAAEAGGIPLLSSLSSSIRPHGNENHRPPSNPTIPPRLLNAARLGQWHQIPEFLHDMIRQNLDNSRGSSGGVRDSTPQPAAVDLLEQQTGTATTRSVVGPRVPTLRSLRSVTRSPPGSTELSSSYRRLGLSSLNRTVADTSTWDQQRHGIIRRTQPPRS